MGAIAIKSSELRPGNWAMNVGSVHYQMTAESIYRLTEIEKSGKIAIDVGPIKLTKELADKFGIPVYNLDQMSGHIHDDVALGYYEIDANQLEYVIESIETGMGVCFVTAKVNFLHRLQNLYFELKNKELWENG